MNAQDFVNLLNSLNLLDASKIEDLRSQAAVANNQLSPQQILKSLLDGGQITREQAKVVVANIQQAKSQAPAEDDVIDLSQGNFSAVPESDDATEEIVDLSQLGGDSADDELIDLTTFGAEEVEDDGSAAGVVKEVSYTTEEEEEANWGGMMIIGNALIFGLLCVGAVVLYVVLANHSAKKTWESALKQYTGGSYQQAKSRMLSFVEEFPNDGNVNRARIYIIMSEVNIQLVSVRKDSIDRIRLALLDGDTRKGFREETEVELSSLMPRLAEFYANAGTVSRSIEDKREYVALAQKTLDVINEVQVLSKVREEAIFQSRIDAVKALMGQAKQLIVRSEALEQTLADIDNFIAAGNLGDAFIARNKLLATYAELRFNNDLKQAVRKISDAEQKRVVSIEPTFVPNNEAIPSSPEHETITSTRNGKNISGVKGYYVTVLAGDSVYGIELATGQVSWRRFVGLQTKLHPIRVSEDGFSDTILSNTDIDGGRYEVVRVDSSTGEQKWRLPVGGLFTQPRIYNGKLYLNVHIERKLGLDDEEDHEEGKETLLGSLLTIDPETGRVERQIQYPMGAHIEPGFDDENGIIYQVGDHSNLYAISVQTGECTGVYYLGHKDGAIVVPAVYAVGYVILVENGQSRSKLHVLLRDEDGFSTGQATKILSSLVRMPPQVFGRRLLVSTELGQIYLYDVDPNLQNPIGPLALMASLEGKYVTPVREFGLAGDGQIYMCGRGLIKYTIQSQLGKLKRDWTEHSTSLFVAPLQKFGDVVVYSRQKQNTTRVTISAHLVKETKASWEVDLARTPGVVFLQKKPRESYVAGKRTTRQVLVGSVGAEE